MSKRDSEPTERLSVVGATDLERRLLEAAGREEPSRELSERMARAIGIALPPVGSGALAPHTAPQAPGLIAAAPKAAASSSSLVSWAAGTILTGAVVLGAFMATRPSSKPVAAPPSVSTTAPRAAAVASISTPDAPRPAVTSSMPAAEPSAGTSQVVPAARGHERAATTDLSDQLALVDAAHRALSGGDAAGALSLARKYSAEYPTGTFRPEAAALRIEALVKLGRTAEARALANKFAPTYGPGPLADRMATVVGSSAP
jgi:hypothetical protein